MPRPLLLSLALALTPVLFTTACAADPAAQAAVKPAQWPFAATEVARFDSPWAMAFLPDTRSQFLMSGVTLAVILVSFEVVRRRPSPAAEPATPVAVTAPQGY